MRRRPGDGDPILATQQLAALFERAAPTRVRAGYVRVDLAEVQRLVKEINRATGSVSDRDWRGRVTVSCASPLATVANDAREVLEHARRIPLTDDVLVRHERAEQLATALRQATVQP